MTDVVQKLWGFCHTLRHDGIDYGDYIEQITFLLFLKMADERQLSLPKGCDWGKLRDKSGTALLDHYADVLRTLARTPGILGDIYAEAQSRFNNSVNLKRLINLIDETEWTSLGVDVKAAAYEGLLEKAASEGKKGAGQYFTPRLLIESIVRCMKPDPRAHTEFTICDPACGTGGFLVASYEWLLEKTKGGALDRSIAKRVRTKTYHGQDLVARPRRLALMNLYLHGIEPSITLGDTIYEPPSSQRFDAVLTNPPFGTRGANQAPDREDFTVATSNKQLNFIQHVITILKPGGRAAIVLPDNCLFADQAGEVFRILTQDCNLHTVLRLPRGTFTPYSPGVKANVVFFTKGYATDTVWIYDARTGAPGVTKLDRPLTLKHFQEFERCYGAEPNGKARRRATDSSEDRWRSFDIAELSKRDFKLVGLKWLKEESAQDADDLLDPEELVSDAIAELQGAIGELQVILSILENGANGSKTPTSSNQTPTRSHFAGDDEEDFEIPEGWATASLSSVFDVNPGKPPADALPSKTPVSFVPMAAVDAEQGSILNAETRQFGDVRKGYTAFRNDDVILAKITPCFENGKAAIARGLLNGWGFGSTEFHVFRPTGTVVPEFLFHYLRQARFREVAAGHMTGTAGQARVPVDYLETMMLLIPPLAEQDRIVARIEALLVALNAVRDRVGTIRVNRLIQAVLAKAFRGELIATEAEIARLEKRPYEPASALIKRIEAKRTRVPAPDSVRRNASGRVAR